MARLDVSHSENNDQEGNTTQYNTTSRPPHHCLPEADTGSDTTAPSTGQSLSRMDPRAHVRRGMCKSNHRNHFRKDNLQNENRFISQMSETKKSLCVHHSGPIWPWSYDYQEHNYFPNDPKTHYLVFALCIGLMFWSMSACKSPSFISVVLMQIKVILNIIFKARATVLKLHLRLQRQEDISFHNDMITMGLICHVISR